MMLYIYSFQKTFLESVDIFLAPPMENLKFGKSFIEKLLETIVFKNFKLVDVRCVRLLMSILKVLLRLYFFILAIKCRNCILDHILVFILCLLIE